MLFGEHDLYSVWSSLPEIFLQGSAFTCILKSTQGLLLSLNIYGYYEYTHIRHLECVNDRNIFICRSILITHFILSVSDTFFSGGRRRRSSSSENYCEHHLSDPDSTTRDIIFSYRNPWMITANMPPTGETAVLPHNANVSIESPI